MMRRIKDGVGLCPAQMGFPIARCDLRYIRFDISKQTGFLEGRKTP